MNRLEQDQVGSCSFVDVLEEAVLVRRPVAIELRDGSYSRMAVRDIAAATRAEPSCRPSPAEPHG